LHKRGCVLAEDFVEWLREYEDAAVSTFPPTTVLEQVTLSATVFSSELPRSATSAEMIIRGRTPCADSVFNEAPLPSLDIPILRLPVGGWAALSRVLWVCGYSGGVESSSDAKKRADKAAGILSAAADMDGAAILVGHGWMNRLIGAALASMGYIRAQSSGTGFWSSCSYSRTSP